MSLMTIATDRDARLNNISIYLKVQFLGRCQIVQSAKDKMQKISLPKKESER